VDPRDPDPDWFVRARWQDNGGKPYCPECGNLDVLSIRRRRYRCTARECRREFSATSGTTLANGSSSSARRSSPWRWRSTR